MKGFQETAAEHFPEFACLMDRLENFLEDVIPGRLDRGLGTSPADEQRIQEVMRGLGVSFASQVTEALAELQERARVRAFRAVALPGARAMSSALILGVWLGEVGLASIKAIDQAT